MSCVAAPAGGYDVSLRLICGLVALHPLGERIRAAVMRAASDRRYHGAERQRAFR